MLPEHRNHAKCTIAKGADHRYSRMFFLEPTDEVEPVGAVLMARFLSKYIAHFGVMVPGCKRPDCLFPLAYIFVKQLLWVLPRKA